MNVNNKRIVLRKTENGIEYYHHWLHGWVKDIALADKIVPDEPHAYNLKSYTNVEYLLEVEQIIAYKVIRKISS